MQAPPADRAWPCGDCASLGRLCAPCVTRMLRGGNAAAPAGPRTGGMHPRAGTHPSFDGPPAPASPAAPVAPPGMGGPMRVEIDWGSMLGASARSGGGSQGRVSISDGETPPAPAPVPRPHPAYHASNIPDPLFAKCMELSLWTSPIPGVRITHDPVNRRRQVFANRAAFALFGVTERLVVEYVKAKRSLIWLHPQSAGERWTDHVRAIAAGKRSHSYRGVYLRHAAPDAETPADKLKSTSAIYPFTAEERVSFDYFPSGVCATVTVFFTGIALLPTPLPAETVRIIRREAAYGRLRGQDSPSCFYCNSRRCVAGDPNLCCPLVLEELKGEVEAGLLPPGPLTSPPSPSDHPGDDGHNAQVAALLGAVPSSLRLRAASATTTPVPSPSAALSVTPFAGTHRDPLAVCEPLPSQTDGAWVPEPFADPFTLPHISGSVEEPLFPTVPLSPFSLSPGRTGVPPPPAAAADAPAPTWWDAELTRGELPDIADIDDMDMTGYA